MERRIREALGDGAKLPGHGKPLDLGPDLGGRREDWASNHVLKNAGMLPPWMELAKEIDALLDQLRALDVEHASWIDDGGERLRSLDSAGREIRHGGMEAIHRRFLQRAVEQAAEAQRKVLRFNLIVPAPTLEKAPLRHDRVASPFVTRYAALRAIAGWPDVPVPAPRPPKDEGDEIPVLRLFDSDENDEIRRLIEEDRAADRRARALSNARKVDAKRPGRGGLPLDWLASLNPLSHAADVLRQRRIAGYRGEADDD